MAIPKYLMREPDIKKESIKQEKRVQRHLNSGALWFKKADLSDDKNLYEYKGTIKRKTVNVTKKMLEKHFKDAHSEGRTPVMIIAIEGYTLIGEVIKI